MASKRARVAGANDHEAGTSAATTNGKAAMKESGPSTVSLANNEQTHEVGPIFIQGFICIRLDEVINFP